MKMHLLVLTTITLIFSGCLYDGGETIVLPINDINPELEIVSSEAIPSEIRSQFTNYMTIHEGSNPPIITGYYLFSPATTVYCSDWGYGGYDVGKVVADLYIYFGEQNKWQIDEYKEKQSGNIGTAKDVVIVGSGKDFTAYYIVEEYLDYDNDGSNESYTKTSVLFSGTLTQDGIEDAQYAFILLEAIDPLDKIMKENEFRIFKDGDGLASTCSSWGYYAPKRVPQENELEINTLTKDAKRDYE